MGKPTKSARDQIIIAPTGSGSLPLLGHTSSFSCLLELWACSLSVVWQAFFLQNQLVFLASSAPLSPSSSFGYSSVGFLLLSLISPVIGHYGQRNEGDPCFYVLVSYRSPPPLNRRFSFVPSTLSSTSFAWFLVFFLLYCLALPGSYTSVPLVSFSPFPFFR